MSENNDRHIDGDLIRRLESLAGLRLAPAERESLAGQLDRIVTFVAQLKQVDAMPNESGSDGTTPVQEPEASPRRSDQPHSSLSRQEVLAQAPETDGCFFMVPPVFLPSRGPWQDKENGAGHE